MWANLKSMPKMLTDKLIQLDIFSKETSDPSRASSNRIATRIYIVTLLISLYILSLFTFLSNRTIHETVMEPTQQQYEYLVGKYSETLQCPCSVVSIPYEDFLQTTPIYHQICSSDFIQSWWYQSMIPANITDIQVGFEYVASSYFHSLKLFCDIANITVNNALRQFASTFFVNSQPMPSHSFSSQAIATLDGYLNMIQADFLYSVSMVNAIILAEQYVSKSMRSTVLQKQYDPVLENLQSGQTRIYAIPVTDYNVKRLCSCAYDSECNDGSRAIIDGSDIILNAYTDLPGISAACFTTTSILKSSLYCWYDSNCIRELQNDLQREGIHQYIQITPLNSSLVIRFPPNTSTQVIFDHMMIEQWNKDISFSNFYQRCHPSYCSYTYEKRSDSIYVITQVTGIFGGLNLILSFFIPLLVRIGLTIVRKVKMRISVSLWATTTTVQRKYYHQLINISE